MTISEAIKSGKRFKRPPSHHWLKVKYLSVVVDGDLGKEWEAFLDVPHLMADDWEIELEPNTPIDLEAAFESIGRKTMEQIETAYLTMRGTCLDLTSVPTWEQFREFLK